MTDGTNAEECEEAAADPKQELRKALNVFRKARTPDVEPDITHGGPGQPEKGVGIKPQGEPGPYVPS